MSLTQILAFFSGLAPLLEPILMNLEQNTIQPQLKALIAKETSPDLKALLTALDSALDAFAQVEITKL